MKTDTEALLAEREKTHGKYSDFAQLVQAYKLYTRLSLKDRSIILSPEHQEALDMIFHKIGRIVTGDPNTADHWADLAGYATLGLKNVRPREQSTSQTSST